VSEKRQVVARKLKCLPEWWEALDASAERAGMSRAAYVRAAVEMYAKEQRQ
jgi:predicted DNA-binding protein